MACIYTGLICCLFLFWYLSRNLAWPHLQWAVATWDYNYTNSTLCSIFVLPLTSFCSLFQKCGAFCHVHVYVSFSPVLFEGSSPSWVTSRTWWFHINHHLDSIGVRLPCAFTNYSQRNYCGACRTCSTLVVKMEKISLYVAHERKIKRKGRAW